MNRKKIILIFVSSILLLIVLNIFIIKKCDSYIYNNYSRVINAIINEYPETEENVIDILLNSKNTKDNLLKYGIDKDTIKELQVYKDIRKEIVFATTITYFSIVLLILTIYYLYSLKVKREINKINKYLQNILKGSYDINIADYNEDEISILKNDICKVAIKLKELSEYERKEQIYLMNTLEDISHQLKTPLTALMVTNDILKNNDLTSEERTNFLNKETKELEKMEWLIITLLKYSKLDSGSVKLKKEKLNVSAMINSILETLSISLELKEVDIELNNLDFTLTCDKNWTKEAITNIIKNAIEHLKEQGHIEISGETNPLYDAIIIKDNGTGIKKEDIKNIFKRFYSTSSSKNSIGIGLNMAKLIIERQNGKIEVESKLNSYTTFKVIFMKKDNY